MRPCALRPAPHRISMLVGCEAPGLAARSWPQSQSRPLCRSRCVAVWLPHLSVGLQFMKIQACAGNAQGADQLLLQAPLTSPASRSLASTLPRPPMQNADLARIINSDEVRGQALGTRLGMLGSCWRRLHTVPTLPGSTPGPAHHA